ncbi:hypothetical protein SAMN00790413_02580 [Deinococcus hopiensis KR-140]|uniref:Uncharacterized protein n=1 Tax=Deinococcus hopiensis KR-140 TaxID=695939 RepID=A0A1W1VNH2_9DEIO|nr:hypothetical protein SAMN00790413_02580 [Deinococcus hopiensis KR-140]
MPQAGAEGQGSPLSGWGSWPAPPCLKPRPAAPHLLPACRRSRTPRRRRRSPESAANTQSGEAPASTGEAEQDAPEPRPPQDNAPRLPNNVRSSRVLGARFKSTLPSSRPRRFRVPGRFILPWAPTCSPQRPTESEIAPGLHPETPFGGLGRGGEVRATSKKRNVAADRRRRTGMGRRMVDAGRPPRTGLPVLPTFGCLPTSWGRLWGLAQWSTCGLLFDRPRRANLNAHGGEWRREGCPSARSAIRTTARSLPAPGHTKLLARRRRRQRRSAPCPPQRGH